jgi:hypothetical protein
MIATNVFMESIKNVRSRKKSTYNRLKAEIAKTQKTRINEAISRYVNESLSPIQKDRARLDAEECRIRKLYTDPIKLNKRLDAIERERNRLNKKEYQLQNPDNDNVRKTKKEIKFEVIRADKARLRTAKEDEEFEELQKAFIRTENLFLQNDPEFAAMRNAHTKWKATERQKISYHASEQKQIESWFSAIKNRAITDNLPFDLELSDVYPFPTHCEVFGIELMKKKGRGPSLNSPTIDRMIPARGYVKGNVRIISQRANLLKRDRSLEELVILGQQARSLIGGGADLDAPMFDSRSKNTSKSTLEDWIKLGQYGQRCLSAIEDDLLVN